MCFYSVFSDIGNLIYDIWGVTIGDEQMKFGFLPWNDDGEFLKVNECLAWAKFTEKDRSPFEPKI